MPGMPATAAVLCGVRPATQQQAGRVGRPATAQQRRSCAACCGCDGPLVESSSSSSSSSSSRTITTQRSASACSAQQRQQQQREERDGAHLPLLQRLGRAAAGVAAAAVLAGSFAGPPEAGAVLANPRAPVPRSADVALRRSIPAFNLEVAEVQDKLEAIAFKLRIPQRKPWGSMGDDVAAAARLAADRPRMLAGVLPPDADSGEELLSDIQESLGRVARAVEVKDPGRTSIRVANALEQVAELELLQAPGLPYKLPRQVAQYPALAGRAVVELTVEKASGRSAFVDPNSSDGPQRRATLRLVLDGYSAPITAANLVQNFQAGLYNNVPLSVTGVAVLAGSQPPDAAAPDEGADGGGAAPAGGARVAPAALPLELLQAGEFEPSYRLPLDVRSGELPVLPLSIYGAVAMAQLPDSDGTNGYVSGRQWFIYLFDRQQAGLAGLSFDEGQFGVCGYIVKGLDAVGRLETGDRIVKAEVVSGLDKLRGT